MGRVLDQDGREHHAERGPDQAGKGHEPDRGGTFLDGKPHGGDLCPGVEQEGLGDRDADGADQHQGVVRAGQSAQDAEDTHQHGADPNRQAETPGIDRPGDRDGKRNVDEHEGHRQETDLEVGDPMEISGGTGDGGIGDPQDLDGEVDEHENSQHDPAIGIQAVGFSSHGWLLSFGGKTGTCSSGGFQKEVSMNSSVYKRFSSVCTPA